MYDINGYAIYNSALSYGNIFPFESGAQTNVLRIKLEYA